MAVTTLRPLSVWIGRGLSALVVTFLVVDGQVALFRPGVMHADMQATGFAPWTAPLVGGLAVVCALVYAVPATALLGAVLVTAFLGGAICTHVRVDGVGSPPQLVSLALGLLAWGGLYLRDARLRALLPLRRGSADG